MKRCRTLSSVVVPVISMLTLAAVASEPPVPLIPVTVEWNHAISTSTTTPTVMVVPSPIFRRSSTTRTLFSALKKLGALNVRYLAWYPYPRLAVAELEPPTQDRTFWDFSTLDSVMVPFLEATEGREAIVSFSTIPAWMFKAARTETYPSDPDTADYSYGSNGLELRDPSGTELATYYARIASWYTQGGFTDELGKFHPSGYHYKLPWWGVLNEPEVEHLMTARQYTDSYDAIVSEVRKVTPTTQFLAVSSCCWDLGPQFLEYFLDARNHRQDIPIDMIGYHFYTHIFTDQSVVDWQRSVFDQADAFVVNVRYLEAIRRRLSPATKVDIDELGLRVTSKNGVEPSVIPDIYWNIGAAYDSYLYVKLARDGINILTASHFAGSPEFTPAESMVDWHTGKGNARYWARVLLNRNFDMGDRWFATRVMDAESLAALKDSNLKEFPESNIFPPKEVAVQAILTHEGKRVLAINKTDHPVDIGLQGVGLVQWADVVDARSREAPPRREDGSGYVLHLLPFAVVVAAME